MSLKVGDKLVCTKSYSDRLVVGSSYKIVGFFLGYSIIDIGDGEERDVCKHTGHVLQGMRIMGEVAKASSD